MSEEHRAMVARHHRLVGVTQVGSRPCVTKRACIVTNVGPAAGPSSAIHSAVLSTS